MSLCCRHRNAWHFNPRSPRGGATGRRLCRTMPKIYFNPRSPRGGATFFAITRSSRNVFQSTLPTRGSDLAYNRRIKADREISIHAPHEGERHSACRFPINHGENFNPRSPRGGATQRQAPARLKCRISIHAPHEGERPIWRNAARRGTEISIHAPHEGERPGLCAAQAAPFHFNPRSPRGGATVGYGFVAEWNVISIHAPHEGERRRRPSQRMKTYRFQSTLPTRGSD